MQTIQYMGSKADLLPFISSSMENYIGQRIEDCHSFQDVFSGSGRVSHYFRHKHKIVSIDKQSFSKVILDAYLKNNESKKRIDEIISYLNNKASGPYDNCDLWFTNHYGGDWNNGSAVQPDKTRRIWLKKNSTAVDIIRTEIDILFPEYSSTKAVLLLSLILAANKVSNVMGHQNGYLKEWSKASTGNLTLKTPSVFEKHSFQHVNFCGDVFKIAPAISTDIAYIDPPYGTNNKKVSKSGHTKYSSFYHLWNTLVENNKPKVWGRANKPMSVKNHTGVLEFVDKPSVRPNMIRLLNSVNAKYIFFSYSNKGLFSKNELEDIFSDSKFNIDSLRIYEKLHKDNNQKKNARIDGNHIDRINDNLPLVEYLFAISK